MLVACDENDNPVPYLFHGDCYGACNLCQYCQSSAWMRPYSLVISRRNSLVSELGPQQLPGSSADIIYCRQRWNSSGNSGFLLSSFSAQLSPKAMH